MAINIPHVPAPVVVFRPLHADVHPLLAAAKHIRDAVLDAQEGGSRAQWLSQVEGNINSALYHLHLLSVEYKDRANNIADVAFSLGRISGVAHQNSRSGPQPLRSLANLIWMEAARIHRDLRDVAWDSPLLVVKRDCGCKVEKLSDEDPGSLLIGCDEARRLNAAYNDAEGCYLGTLLNASADQPDAERDSKAAYDALHAHFGGE